MGHIRVGTLPATRRWKDVVGLIAEGAEAPLVAEAVTHAWEQAFIAVRSDAGFREAVWLLMQIGVAGKSRDPTGHPEMGPTVDWSRRRSSCGLSGLHRGCHRFREAPSRLQIGSFGLSTL